MKMRMILLIICFGVLSGCTVIINPVTDMVIKDSDGNILLNNLGNFNFGNQLIKTPKSATFKIENNGKKTLELTGTPIIEISGPDANSFSIVKIPDKTILSGESTTFEIEFTPVEATTHYIFVSISNSNENTNPYTFTVYGEGIAPTLRVKQDSTFIPPTTGVYDFDDVNINGSSRLSIFTIENVGTGELNLAGTPKIIISGADKILFTLDDTSTVSTIGPGESTTFSVTFKPTTTGDKSATISIESNDIGNNPYVFTIKGSGIAEPEINVQDSLSNNIPNGSGTFDFGAYYLNYFVTERFDIQNLGNNNLLLNGSPIIEISGTGADAFSVVMQPDSNVNPGDTTTFLISFTPTCVGSKSATILFANNDTDENPYTFTITGEGSMYAWTKQIGGARGVQSSLITTDKNGNLFVSGSYSGTVDFGADFGVSDVKTTSTTRYATFVTKINSNYTYAWTRSIGDENHVFCRSITTDTSGDVYITGEFDSTVNFAADFGSTDTKVSNGSDDIFVTRIHSDGSYGWTKSLGGTNHLEIGKSIAADSIGNLYITGTFTETNDFGADFGVSDVITPTKSYAIFITKITTNASYCWSKCLLSSYTSNSNLTTDVNNNIYIVGNFNRTVDFGLAFGVTDIKTSKDYSTDIFITKINTNGSYAWTKHIGGTDNDYGRLVTTDTSGNIFIAGEFNGAINFGEDFSVVDNKTTHGNSELYISKINSNGTYGWTRQIGNVNDEGCGNNIVTDSSGSVFLAGSFNGSINFGSDFGESEVKTCYGIGSDVFIIKVLANGDFAWTKQIGSTKDDSAGSVAIDTSNDIFLTGSFSETVDFGADFGVSDSKTSAGFTDGFITKLLH